MGRSIGTCAEDSGEVSTPQLSAGIPKEGRVEPQEFEVGSQIKRIARPDTAGATNSRTGAEASTPFIAVCIRYAYLRFKVPGHEAAKYLRARGL